MRTELQNDEQGTAECPRSYFGVGHSLLDILLFNPAARSSVGWSRMIQRLAL
jgi:hypothetical protein